MLSAFESLGIIVASIAAALVALFLLRRFWLSRGRSQHNDMIGWQIGFLGTTYAVIVAFVLSDVWQNYQTAARNAEIEANALLNIYRVSSGLPAPQKSQVAAFAERYAVNMIHDEWPAMQAGKHSLLGQEISRQLWTAMTSTQPKSFAEQACLERALAELTTLTEQRRIREADSDAQIPLIFWTVLIAGGALTIIYTCLFEIEELRMHVTQVVGVTLLVSLILTTIADIDSPYGGAIKIAPTAFESAQRAMR